MKNNPVRQRVYATLLALGASILTYRTVTMISQGALNILALWVSILLFIEMLIDIACFLTTIPWWISKDRSRAITPLRLGAAAALFHAFRVLVFVLGRAGPWKNFDVRPEQIEAHTNTWTWAGVYFAAIMSILGVTGVIIIWMLIRRANKS
jgi:hypothetical protein